MKRVNVHLGERQIRALRALSHKTEQTFAALVRRAVDEFLARRKSRKASASDHPK
ncbi:MAG: ribbon-helix-helix protein, CopG family [Terriglobia bacterium]